LQHPPFHQSPNNLQNCHFENCQVKRRKKRERKGKASKAVVNSIVENSKQQQHKNKYYCDNDDAIDDNDEIRSNNNLSHPTFRGDKREKR
jgi:hypothetical protein